MAYFEAKIFDFSWVSATDPARGACKAAPDLLAGFHGPTSKGKRGEGRGYRRENGRI